MVAAVLLVTYLTWRWPVVVPEALLLCYGVARWVLTGSPEFLITVTAAGVRISEDSFRAGV